MHQGGAAGPATRRSPASSSSTTATPSSSPTTSSSRSSRKRTRTIEIDAFVDLGEVDPIHFDHPYLLIPAGDDDGTLRPYRLLLEVMGKTDRAALGRFVMRTKEYRAIVRARDGALSLTTMLMHDEVRPTKGIDSGSKGKAPKEAARHRARAHRGDDRGVGPRTTRTSTGRGCSPSSSRSARARRSPCRTQRSTSPHRCPTSWPRCARASTPRAGSPRRTTTATTTSWAG